MIGTFSPLPKLMQCGIRGITSGRVGSFSFNFHFSFLGSACFNCSPHALDQKLKIFQTQRFSGSLPVPEKPTKSS